MRYWAIINNVRVPFDFNSEPLVGGEGEVFFVEGCPYQDYCAKIYLPNNKNITEIESKLKYMVGHKPIVNSDDIRICWPEFLIYDSGNVFRGFLMKRAFSGSRDLDILQDNGDMESLSKEYPKWPEWSCFDLHSSDGRNNRISLLHKIAKAIDCVHSLEGVIIHDFKPSNILATVEGAISVVDVDSFQITTSDGTFYPSYAYTPDYFPKHAYELAEKKQPQRKESDVFAFAVVAYNTLFGVHPYSGFIRKPPFDDDMFSGLAECIKNGLSPYSENKKYVQFLDSEFNHHKAFEMIDPLLQNLFVKSFSDYEAIPQISEWVSTFNTILGIDQEDIFNGVDDKNISLEKIHTHFTGVSIPLEFSILVLLHFVIILLLICRDNFVETIIGSNSIVFYFVALCFSALYLFSSIKIAQCVIWPKEYEKEDIVNPPTANNSELSDSAKDIMMSIRQDVKKSKIIAINNILYDYLHELNCSTPVDLLSYLPTKRQVDFYPIDSIQLMLSAEHYIQFSKVEDKFFNYSCIIKEIQASFK